MERGRPPILRHQMPRLQTPAPERKEPGIATDEYYEIKTRIHDRLIDLIDLSLLDTLDEGALGSEIGKIVERLLRDEFFQTPLNQIERDRLISEVKDEMLGLGPLEPFLKDPSVNDILVNSYRQIYVERSGKLVLTESRFKDNDHLKKIIDRIVSRVGRRVDESSPMVDARLPDGSRVNAIIPPLAIDGPALSIRKFAKEKLTIEDLIRYKAMTRDIADVLRGIVLARLNILISGGTGTGKTTMLNCLSGFIPHDERIVTVEDAAELQLKQDHVVRLESRPPNIEGRGEVTQRDLVRNCLRMRPDRIIVGEVRGAEALDMLQAMNTGHDGSLATLHANTPRDALMRLETLVAMAGLNISALSLKRYIASAVDVIIQISRFSDGSRKLVSFQELTGMEGEVITMQEIFAFEQRGMSADAKVKGAFVARGIRPKFAVRAETKGIKMPEGIFDPRNVAEV
ncbi:CpaF family protein [Solidesulfovibrio sp.]